MRNSVDSLVNNHITIDPVEAKNFFCEIKKRRKSIFEGIMIRRWLFPSKRPDLTLATAEFTAEELKLHKDKDTIKTGVRSIKGVTSRSSFLKIDVLQKHWKDAYGDSGNVVIDGEMERFYRVKWDLISYLLDRVDNNCAHDLPAPVDPANPDLEIITPIPELERLAFPKYDEFDLFPKHHIFAFVAVTKLWFLDSLTPFANRAKGIQQLNTMPKDQKKAAGYTQPEMQQ